MTMTVFDETKSTESKGIGFGVSGQVAAVEGAIEAAETELRQGVDRLVGRMKALSNGSFLMELIQEGLQGTEFSADSLFSGVAIDGEEQSILSLAAGDDAGNYFEDSIGYENQGKS